MESVFNVTAHVIPAAYIREYPQATANSQDDTLQLHVKQYTPKDNPNPQKGDISIVGSHANGFPKELYEPLWVELYHSLKQQGLRIRSIWAIDAAWQGQSGLLNRDKLGNDPGWLDYTRDIYQVINHVRMPRPIVGIGHSFGGAAITGASLINPRLFNALILMDPVLQAKPDAEEGENVFINKDSPAGLSTFRRDVWPSRAEARASFAKSFFYKSWDPRVLDCWVQHGLTDTKDGKVTLTTSKHQEVRTFVRSTTAAFNEDGTKLLHPERIPEIDPATATKQAIWPIYRSESDQLFHRLGQVRPPLLYIFGEDSYLSAEPLRDAKMAVTGIAPGGSGGAAKGKVKSIIGQDLGHLIPMEDPKLCADSAAAFISEHLPAWREEEKQFQEFAKQPIEVKSHMGQDIVNLYAKGRENKL